MDVETSCQERLFPQVDDRGRSPLAQRRHFSRPGEMHGDPARVAAAMRFTSEPTVVRPPPWLSGNFAAENDAHSPQASSAGIDSLTLGATISSRQLGASAIWGGRAMRQNMADKNRASPQNVTAADGSTQPVRTNISGSSLRPVNLHSDYRFDSSASRVENRVPTERARICVSKAATPHPSAYRSPASARCPLSSTEP
jgi:hypothetical protein